MRSYNGSLRAILPRLTRGKSARTNTRSGASILSLAAVSKLVGETAQRRIRYLTHACDWRELPNWVAIARRNLERAGLPPEPHRNGNPGATIPRARTDRGCVATDGDRIWIRYTSERTMRMIVAGSLLALLLAAGVAHSAESIPADTASAAESDDAVVASDLAEEAVNTAWEAYRAHILEVLRASNNPRDWTLAARFALDGETDALKHAAEDAPDDVLVQWLVANDYRRDSTDCVAMAQAAARRLVKLESDNGAAWVLVLDLAYQRDDHAAVSEALANIAASDRFDLHFGDLLHAWMAVYDRYPPDEDISSVSREEGFSGSFVTAMASVSAMALPAFQSLIKICKDESASADIRASCLGAGHLMLHEGKTLVARDIGFVLLRNLGNDVLSGADLALHCDRNWYSWQGAAHAMGSSEANRQWNAAFEAAWRDQSSEIVAIQHVLKQLGISSEPPPGWTMPKSPWITPDS